MTQFELDNGILEKLMNSSSINTASYSNTTAKSAKQKSPSLNTKKKLNTNNKRILPIVQVLNIENIASPKVTTANKNNDDNNNVNLGESNSTDNKTINNTNSISSDHYLLILSDGVYYETTCLLLPKLNYLINENKLRKGSVIRLDRFDINTMSNRKFLVIEDLTVLNTNTNTQENSATKATITNIGNLKPTTNFIQIKNSKTSITNGSNSTKNTSINTKPKARENNCCDTANSLDNQSSTSSTNKKPTGKHRKKSTSDNNNNVSVNLNNNLCSDHKSRFTILKKSSSCSSIDFNNKNKNQYKKVFNNKKSVSDNEEQALKRHRDMLEDVLQQDSDDENIDDDEYENDEDENEVEGDEDEYYDEDEAIENGEDQENEGEAEEDDDEDDEEEEEEEDDDEDEDNDLDVNENDYEDEDEEEDDEEEDDEEEEQQQENDYDYDDESCKCLDCQDKNTLRLCYKMFGLTERASKDQVREKYFKLLKENSFMNSLDFNLLNSNLNFVINSENTKVSKESEAKQIGDVDEETARATSAAKPLSSIINEFMNNENFEFNEDIENEEDDDSDEFYVDEEFIKNISSSTFNIFSEADRLDLITKAYSLIMGIKSDEENEDRKTDNEEENEDNNSQEEIQEDSEKYDKNGEQNNETGNEAKPKLSKSKTSKKKKLYSNKTPTNHNTNLFDESHLFELLNKQNILKNKMNKYKLKRIAVESSDLDAELNKLPLLINQDDKLNSDKYKNITISDSKSALTSLDKKLLKEKIMSNIGKMKIEDYFQYAWVKAVDEFNSLEKSSKSDGSKEQKDDENHESDTEFERDDEEEIGGIDVYANDGAENFNLKDFLSKSTFKNLKHLNLSKENEQSEEKEPVNDESDSKTANVSSNTNETSTNEFNKENTIEEKFKNFDKNFLESIKNSTSSSNTLSSYQKRKNNRNSTALYQHLKKIKQTKALKSIRNKQMSNTTAANSIQPKQFEANTPPSLIVQQSTIIEKPQEPKPTEKPDKFDALSLISLGSFNSNQLENIHVRNNKPNFLSNPSTISNCIASLSIADSLKKPGVTTKPMNDSTNKAVSKEPTENKKLDDKYTNVDELRLSNNRKKSASASSSNETAAAKAAQTKTASSNKRIKPSASSKSPATRSSSSSSSNSAKVSHTMKNQIEDSKMSSSDSSTSIKKSLENQIQNELLAKDSQNTKSDDENSKELSLNKLLVAKKRKNESTNNVSGLASAEAKTEPSKSQQEEESQLKKKKKKKKKKTASTTTTTTTTILSLGQNYLNANLNNQLEQEKLEKQLIEQQKIQQEQIEQLQKQIDEIVDAENEDNGVLETVLNENDFNKVLNDLSEALTKTTKPTALNSKTSEITETDRSNHDIDKIKSIIKLEEKFKKNIDLFQKEMNSQIHELDVKQQPDDGTSKLKANKKSNLVKKTTKTSTSITTISTKKTITKSDIKLENNGSKIVKTSTSAEADTKKPKLVGAAASAASPVKILRELSKAKSKEVSKILSAYRSENDKGVHNIEIDVNFDHGHDNDEEYNEDDDDDEDYVDEDEDDDDDEDGYCAELQNMNCNDHLITIIMKPPKGHLIEDKIRYRSSGNASSKAESKSNVLYKDKVKTISFVENDERIESHLSSLSLHGHLASNRKSSVEEILKTISNNEDNIIFVQPMSSDGKKQSNAQAQTQPKANKSSSKQSSTKKDVLIESNTIIRLGSSPTSTAEQLAEAQELKNSSQFELLFNLKNESQKSTKNKPKNTSPPAPVKTSANSTNVNSNPAKTAPSVDTTTALTKNQRKKNKKLMKKKLQEAESVVNTEQPKIVEEKAKPVNEKKDSSVEKEAKPDTSKAAKKKKKNQTQVTTTTTQDSVKIETLKPNELKNKSTAKIDKPVKAAEEEEKVAENSTTNQSKSKKSKKKKKNANEANTVNQIETTAQSAAKNNTNANNKSKPAAQNKDKKANESKKNQKNATKLVSKLDTFNSTIDEKDDNDSSDMDKEDRSSMGDDDEILDDDEENNSNDEIESNLKTAKNKLNEIDDYETSSQDDQGDWVKVSSSGAEKKSKNKNNAKTALEQPIPAALIKPKASTSTNSSKLNELDVIDITTKSSKTQSKTVGSSLNSLDPYTDLLIPSTIDEEEIMLRKALELSLKETNMASTESKSSAKTTVVERKSSIGLSKLDTIDDFSDESFVVKDNSSAKAKTTLLVKSAPIQTKPTQPVKLKQQAPAPNTKPVMSVPPQAQAKKAEQPATNVSSNTATPKTFAAVASGKKTVTKPTAQSTKQPAVAAKPPQTQTSKWSTAKPASSGLNSLDVVDDVIPVSSISYGLETAAANTELSFDLPSLLTPVGSFPSLAPISKPITKPASLPNMENKNVVDLSLNNLDEISTLAALDPNFDDQHLDVPIDQSLLLTSNSLFDLANKNELVDHVSASMGFTSELNTHTPSFSLLDEKPDEFAQFNLSVKPFLVNDSLFGLGGIIPSGLINDEAKSNLVFEPAVSPIKKPIGAERQASNSTSKNASNSNLTTPQSPSLQKQYMDVGFGGTGHKIPTPPLTSLQMMSDVAQTNPIRPSSTSSLQSSSAKSVSNPIQTTKSVIAKPSQASNRSTPSPHQNQIAPSEPVQQKQTIRVQPQQKLNPQPKPPTPQPQQQQQSQQQQTQAFLQQQLLINNLQSLLINGNNEIDQQQVTSLIMQLINQNNLSLNSLNAWNQPAQQNQQPPKNTNPNPLQMPFVQPGASLNKQQAFNPNQASFVNNNPKMFNAATASTNSSFNPLMWQNDLGLNTNLNNNFKSATTPSPPPTTASSNNSTSSSSSINAQSNSSSSTPSPHLINPQTAANQQMFANSSLFPAQYNYFGNANTKTNAFPSFNPLTSMPIVKPNISYANQAQQMQQQSQFRVNTGLSQHPSASNSPFNALNSSSGLQANQTPIMFNANPQSVSFGLTSSLLAQQQQQQQAVSSSLLTNNQISSLLPNPIMRANNFQSNSTNMNNFNRHNFE